MYKNTFCVGDPVTIQVIYRVGLLRKRAATDPSLYRIKTKSAKSSFSHAHGWRLGS